VEEAKRLIGDSAHVDKVRFGYDFGFALHPRRPERIQFVGGSCDDAKDKTVVGLNVSGLLMMGGYDRHNMFSLKVGYRELTDAIMRRLLGVAGVHILLVPHVFGADAESDQSACRAIYDDHIERYPGRISCVESRHDQHEMKYVIGRCEFFVGARMHACIAALSQAVPAMCVAYSRKFAGVLESIGAEQLVVDPRTMSLAEIVDAVADRFADRRKFTLELGAQMPGVKRKRPGSNPAQS
jgi:polysaccharide pyruvyl transferase WcaK-like protein